MDLWTRIMRGYGTGCTRNVTVITCFHFRPFWRGDELAPDNEPVWRQLHREPGRLPDVMRWTVPEGMVEQEAVWRRLSAEPEIVPQLRDACHRALTTYTWHLEQQLSVQQGLAPVAELDRKIQTLREQKEALQSKLAERDVKLQRMKEELELMKRGKKRRWLGWLRGR